MKKALFIDRDGTLIKEPADYQIDAFEKLVFYPEVFQYMAKIAKELDFDLVMVSNQDGLGTDSFPEHTFWPVQQFILDSFEREGVVFKEVLIDRSFPHENKPSRKPGTALLEHYMDGSYDLARSFVIGDRITDVALAKNLGAKALFLNQEADLGAEELESASGLKECIALETTEWKDIYTFLRAGERVYTLERNTHETQIAIRLDLDGQGRSNIQTGLAFFDHMLDQISRHGLLDLDIQVKGDLQVDEHHTIEDTAIALGTAFHKALGNKLGIERYGFCLPMDDCEAQVSIDFGGRNWLVWEAQFKREMIGQMPTEMFMHFFKSFSDGAQANLNIKASGDNEHHKIEAIFKAFAKAIKMAIKRDADKLFLPSTKGVL
ncbi:MAG: bifunctional histidinol-phosphatase/imidazoleglycerol-phosphate dehydratase HisB [Flavobacteriaceae bacterium]|nr:bifunctional histidinol-phosphatase/imidazoleglycerol-phosphate dehydratase HisB [Flavobacteriaceae bacterium]MCI5087574.1 bifunctional histidinol-phosphatase/imidazoleglycerol-phosphate dehydratase HisB [Flavobacteriaceae bacterium]